MCKVQFIPMGNCTPCTLQGTTKMRHTNTNISMYITIIRYIWNQIVYVVQYRLGKWCKLCIIQFNAIFLKFCKWLYVCTYDISVCNSPVYVKDTNRVLSIEGAHLPQIVCMAGNDTPQGQITDVKFGIQIGSDWPQSTF